MHTLATWLTRASVAALLLSLAPVPVLAQGSPPACQLVDYDPTRRPEADGAPTAVGVGVYLVRLDRVDNLDQSFRLDAFFRLSWRDPRLAAVVGTAGVERCRFPLEAVWGPREHAPLSHGPEGLPL